MFNFSLLVHQIFVKLGKSIVNGLLFMFLNFHSTAINIIDLIMIKPCSRHHFCGSFFIEEKDVLNFDFSIFLLKLPLHIHTTLQCIRYTNYLVQCKIWNESNKKFEKSRTNMKLRVSCKNSIPKMAQGTILIYTFLGPYFQNVTYLLNLDETFQNLEW